MALRLILDLLAFIAALSMVAVAQWFPFYSKWYNPLLHVFLLLALVLIIAAETVGQIGV